MAKKEPTESDIKYISDNKNKQLKILAKETGLHHFTVRKILRDLEKKSSDNSTETKSSGYEVKNGTVIMTKEASEKGDNSQQLKDGQKTYLEIRAKNAIHILDPNKPIY